MSSASPRATDLFSDVTSPGDVTDRFETYKTKLNKSLSRRMPHPSAGPVGELEKMVNSAELTKSVGPQVINSLRQSIAQIELQKDLNVAGPGSTGGLVAYDLQAPALELAPKMTPLRNKMPRKKGIGTSHRYKRITGWSNSSTGGVADLWLGITETGTNTIAGQTLRRGPVMSYAGDQSSIPYMTFSASNSVSWEAEFAGYGYEDIRQLATTTLLYSSMLFEEKVLIEGRGTMSPFSGGLGAPTGVVVSCAAPGSGQVATTGITGHAYAVVTACTRWGETPISSGANASFTTGNLVTVSWTPVVGAFEYRVYLGGGSSDPTSTGYWLQLPNGGTFTTSATSISFQGAVTTSGTAASTVTVSDTTAQATGYDGILSYVLGADSGYVNRVNGTLSTNAGSEIQTVCASLFDAVKAQPQEILCNGFDRKQLSDLLKNTESSNYRLQLLPPDAHNAQIGTLVTGIQNEVTGDFLDITVSPWWPQGTMAVMSWTLPIPDSNVSEVWSLYGPQDFMSVEWPAVQFSYDSSTFWQNALVCFAPEFNGAVTGIVKA